MNISMLKAIIILPGSALVFIPAALLWMTRGGIHAASFPPAVPMVWLMALGFAAPGFALMIWSSRLFMTKGGGGTPAPWNPIQNFIITGPYRYVRNPMLIGVHLVLTAEGILLDSVPILAWMVVFWLGNTLYFKFREEPELLARHGEQYARYKARVPRWIPRLTSYRPSGPRSQSDA